MLERMTKCTWCGCRLAWWQRAQCGTCTWTTLVHVGDEVKWCRYQSRTGAPPDRLRLGWPPVLRSPDRVP